MGWEAHTHQQFHACFGFGVHDAILISVPPIPCKLFHISLPIFLNGAPGWLGSYPSKNYFDGPSDSQSAGAGGDLGAISAEDSDAFIDTLGPGNIPFMGRATDAGLVVPHISIPPNNSLIFLTILFGGSISIFGSSQVRLKTHNMIFSEIFGDEVQDVACCVLGTWPLSLNVSCNDPIPLPFDFAISPNDVKVGVELSDLLTAFLDYLVEIAFAVIGNVVGDAIGGAPVFKNAKKNIKKLKQPTKAAKEAWGAFKGGVKDMGAMSFSSGARQSKRTAALAEMAGKRGGGESVDAAAGRVGKAKEAASGAKGRVDQAGEAVEGAKRQLDELDGAVRQIDDQLGELDGPLRQTTDELDEIDRGLRELETAPRVRGEPDPKVQAEHDLRRSDLHRRQRELNAQKADLEARQADLRGQKADLEGKRPGLEADRGAKQAELDRRRQAQQALDQELGEARDALRKTEDAWRQAELEGASMPTRTWRQFGGAFVGKMIYAGKSSAIRAATSTAEAMGATPQLPPPDGDEAEHPSVVLSSDDLVELAGSWQTDRSPIALRVEFSKPVRGFALSHARAVGALAANLRQESDTVYALDLTPQVETGGYFTVDVDAAQVSHFDEFDLELPNKAAQQLRVRFIAERPSVALTSSEGGATNRETVPMTARFNEPVTGFDASGLQVQNASIEAFTAASEREYSFELRPAADGEVAVRVLPDRAFDRDERGNSASALFSIDCDREPPRVEIDSAFSGTTGVPVMPFTVTFSEPVRAFDEGHVRLSNAEFERIEAVEEGRIYTLEVAPLRDGPVTVTVPAGGIEDEAGNPNPDPAEYTLAYDGSHPEQTLAADYPDLPPEEVARIQAGLEIMGEPA